MICSKCGFDCVFVKDGLDGQPTCSFCAAVSVARRGYENAALANALITDLAKYFIPDTSILGKLDEMQNNATTATEVSIIEQERESILKRGRGRPRKS